MIPGRVAGQGRPIDAASPPPEEPSGWVSPAMRRRSLRSEAAEREWVLRCLSPNGYPDYLLDAMVDQRMAQWAATCAWAEVEYAAWSSCNAVQIHKKPHPQPTMEALVAAAYEATNVMAAYAGPVMLAEARVAREHRQGVRR